MFKVSVERPRVRSAAVPLTLSVTAVLAVLMHVLLLLGTPAVQLEAKLQFPAPPPCQLVAHCAKAGRGDRNKAISAIRRNRLEMH
jgi:hypothetical protein